jgi:hypothetical protein
MWGLEPMARALLAGLAASLVLPVPGFAEPPLSAAEFEAHVIGKTVTYQRQEFIFGIEEYLPDRRVRWSVTADRCQYGIWYPQGDDICFVYEYDPTPACWTFWLRGGALVALSVDGLPGEELYEVDASTQPLPCPGPDVGV